MAAYRSIAEKKPGRLCAKGDAAGGSAATNPLMQAVPCSSTSPKPQNDASKGKLVGMRLVLIALISAATFGCSPSTGAVQTTDAVQKPCAAPAIRTDMTFNTIRDARFSAAVAVRQANQTHVVVADLVEGRLCSLGSWASASVESVYVGEDSSLLVVDKDLIYVVRGGVTSKGPRQSVYDVLFIRSGTETRIIAWIDTRGPSQVNFAAGQSIFDLTAPDKPVQLAPIGGRLLGQLDDGTILVAATTGVGTNAMLALQSVGLDGTVKTLGTVLHARHAIEFHKTPRQEASVAVFGAQPSFDDVITVDLASGAQSKTGTLAISTTNLGGGPSPDDALLATVTFTSTRGVRVTTAAGADVFVLTVPAGTPGEVVFRGWVRR